ncbi:neuronal acetylcholine receptor subunit beta-2-like [Physella acuta]|uniref:neuronal acetylcholine receptor subunit beta-2-like n=1 Tax=Physella acuta TaxID=109671 RepID=UPI0027DEA8FD|nr:neuronal acetylcholine receptor subunit beta-2-like [Physella acuta]
MTLSTRELEFVATTDSVGEVFFILNGEWDLKSSKVEISRFNSGPVNLSSIEMTITIKRRPFYLLINIVLPVVFLSFLNLLVFVIPVESGEKIGFGITVLLALSMSMSLISGMLPKSSLTIPKLTIYLFVLLIISLLTVVDNVIIAFMYHKQQNEFLKSEKEKLNRGNHPSSQQTKSSINTQSITLESLPRVMSSESLHSDYGYPEFSSAASSRRYSCIDKYIDSVSFVSFFLIWVVVTAYYFVDLTSH